MRSDDGGVWLRHRDLGWSAGHIISQEGTRIKCRTEDGEECIVDPDDVLPKNPSSLVASQDLSDLPHLDEPNVIESLRVRYDSGDIYTYTGPTLLALNPWRVIPSLYSEETKRNYRPRCNHSSSSSSSSSASSSPADAHAADGAPGGPISPSGSSQDEEPWGARRAPHVYDVAKRAFEKLWNTGESQAILVSGESGAGKTETTKCLMKMLCEASSSSGGGGLSHIEQLVLQSNPILEAFGNACTLRNHNSSRFGKFITLYFTPPVDGGNSPQISGASIETLLLEKSRVAALSPGERNYHIFYQVQSGDSTSPDMQGPFRILGDNGVGDIEGDSNRREETKGALLALGMKEEEWAEVVRVVGAVMHLGNVEIEADTNSKGSSDVDRAVMRDGGASEAASRLLGVDDHGLREALLTREIRMSDEVVTVCNSKSMSEAARDGVSKALYGNLFNWVVNLINCSLSLGDDGTGSFARVGILDIFGFESFANNSLEQLCINFANEKLQHQFLDFTIKIEQEEYERERIAWDTIVFPDNSGTVALFESRPSGILSLLDEECRVPRGSDSGFALKVRSSNDPLVAAPKMMPGSFIIKHYAQDVTYNTKGFLERNKDQFSPSLLALLQTTSSPFIRRLFTPEAKQQRQAVSPRLARHKSARVMQESIGSQFKRQLGNLIDRIRETNPHYVRCINPNTTKKAGEFEAETVTTQLRYSGVLEAMRFARTGFPSRFTFKDFASKYGPLLMQGGGVNKRGASAMSPGGGRGRGGDEGAAREVCVRLLMHEGVQESEAQAGCHKVFLKAECVERLDVSLSLVLGSSAKSLQAAIRRSVVPSISRLASSAITIQSAARRVAAFRLVSQLRRQRAAACLGGAVRGFLARIRARAAGFEAKGLLVLKDVGEEGEGGGRAMDRVGDGGLQGNVQEGGIGGSQELIDMQLKYAALVEGLEADLCCERARAERAEEQTDAAEAGMTRMRRELNAFERRMEELEDENVALREANARLEAELAAAGGGWRGSMELDRSTSGGVSHREAASVVESEELKRHIEGLSRQRGRLTQLLGGRIGASSPDRGSYMAMSSSSSSSSSGAHGRADPTPPRSNIASRSLVSISPQSAMSSSREGSPSPGSSSSPISVASTRGDKGQTYAPHSPVSLQLSTSPSPRHGFPASTPSSNPSTSFSRRASPSANTTSSSNNSVSSSNNGGGGVGGAIGGFFGFGSSSRQSSSTTSMSRRSASPAPSTLSSALGPINTLTDENSGPSSNRLDASPGRAGAAATSIKDRLLSLGKSSIGGGGSSKTPQRSALSERRSNTMAGMR